MAAAAAAQAEESSQLAASAGAEGGARKKSLTIGAVCKALAQEFPNISISKIRYLEDQKLLTPRRTPGGYRLYTQGDVARLRTILRMQRDEFLPLRVIRQELAAGRSSESAPASPGPARDGARALAPERALGERSTARCTRWRTCWRRPRPTRSWCTSSKSSASSRARCARGALLRRDRARDHLRGGRAGALRRRRSQPAGVPHLGRSRGQPAAADPRAGAALTQRASVARRPSRRSRTSPRWPLTSSTCC